jgi:hypothetical protein
VNIKIKQKLVLEVTDEKVYDGRKVMPKLVEHILKNKNDIKIKSAFLGALMMVMRTFITFKRIRLNLQSK